MTDDATNILLITIDCWRYDRCGFTGHHRETTPTLDAIARESHLFDQAYATGTYTTESVPGIVSGMHSHNGVYFGEDPAWKAIPSGNSTIASHLRSLDYSTTAVLTNPHLSSDRNFNKGFDKFLNHRLEDSADRAASNQSRNSITLTDKIRLKLRSSGILDTVPVISAGRAYQYLTEWPSVQGSTVTNTLLEELDRVDSPFFAWTHFMDIHRPIHPDVVSHSSSEFSPSISQQFRIDAHAAANQFDPRFEAIYDTAVRYVDYQINRIVEWLQQKDEWENTILIVTGDHGETLYDRGQYGHPRHYMYDELLHVPLLVRDPGRESRRISEPFSLAWLGELVTELIDVSPPEFPASSGRQSHLDPDIDEETLVVSDSLDVHGHSVAVQNSEYKYVAFYQSENSDPTAVYTPNKRGYRTMADQGERVPVDPKVVPQSLINKAEEIISCPSELSRINGEFTHNVERKLEQLGYKM